MKPNLIGSYDLKEYKTTNEYLNKINICVNYREELKNRFAHVGVVGESLPWKKTQATIGIRGGEVTIWGGHNSHGKSLLLGQVVSGLIDQGSGVMIASMEMRPTASLYRMCRQATMRPDPDETAIDEYLNWADDKLWFFDYDGSVYPASLLQLIRFSADVLKCKHVVVDSLMKCRISSKDPDAYRDFINEVCVVAKDFDIHVHLVAHSRKGETDRDLITRMDIKGPSEIIDQVENCFLIWRNKKKEEEMEAGEFRKADEPDAIVIVDKHRHGEWEGKINLWYDKRSLQYCETIERKPINLMSAPRAAGGTANVKSNSLEAF